MENGYYFANIREEVDWIIVDFLGNFIKVSQAVKYTHMCVTKSYNMLGCLIACPSPQASPVPRCLGQRWALAPGSLWGAEAG